MSDERIAVLETRVDSIGDRMGGMEKTVCNMGSKIDEIHNVVVANRTNMSWVKKLTMIILGLCLSGAGIWGWNNIKQEASAKKISHERPNDNHEIKRTKR